MSVTALSNAHYPVLSTNTTSCALLNARSGSWRIPRACEVSAAWNGSHVGGEIEVGVFVAVNQWNIRMVQQTVGIIHGQLDRT